MRTEPNPEKTKKRPDRENLYISCTGEKMGKFRFLLQKTMDLDTVLEHRKLAGLWTRVANWLKLVMDEKPGLFQ